MLEQLEAYQSWHSGLSKEDKDRFMADIRVNKIDEDKKKEIKALAKRYLAKSVSFNCGSCLLDSHVLLLRLNTEDMEKTSEYRLLVGTFLHDPIDKVFDLILSPPKLTEDLALYHLTFNPLAKRYFAALPGDIGKRVGEYLKGFDSEMQDKAVTWAKEQLQTLNEAEAKAEKARAKAAAKKAPKEPKVEAE